MLILPSQQVHAYIVSEDQIKAHEAEKYARRETVEPGDMPTGPTMTATELMASDPTIDFISPADNVPAEEVLSAPAKRTVSSSSATTHKVGAGETLASIASRYGVTPAELKSWNNPRRNSVRVGQQLRVAAPGSERQQTSVPASQPAQAAQQSKPSRQQSAPATAPSKNSKKNKMCIRDRATGVRRSG